MRKCLYSAGAVRRQVRRIVIGQDEQDDFNYRVKRTPEYAEKHKKFHSGQKNQSVNTYTTTRMTGRNVAEAQMFEEAEWTSSSAGHKRSMEDMANADNMPKYKVRERHSMMAPSYLPKRGTEIIDARQGAAYNGVIGYDAEGWSSTTPGQSQQVSKRSSIALYRAFWRVLFKMPEETRPRLSRILRKNFKQNMRQLNSEKRNAVIAAGKQILLRYADILARPERRRIMHDPVERFLHMEAELKEREIDNLDFYPYSNRRNELKPIKDIGFHMVFRRARRVGSPQHKVGNNAGLRRHVFRSFRNRLPTTSSLRRSRGKKLLSNGHNERISTMLRFKSRKHPRHSPANEFCEDL
eukprot:TRINITY_DN37268_c0_g1_i1.p1 TRINITY_DN37268_c0_g1~~TRINITY_DN37268_c0_g1_i1.p1  ORF type:complete len:352 (+),score=57.69 TRINITY_DN37268_c0_g1_i1:44-1099(+)